MLTEKEEKELIEKCRLVYDEPIEIFIDELSDRYIGFNISGCDQVTYIHKNRDYEMIWNLCPNAVRLGQGESTPYDFAIIGYLMDSLGNGRIVYSYEMICDSLVREYGCSYDEAIDDVEYNTLRSLPYIREVDRPIIIHTEDI